jgi:hypothetical protein
MRLAACGLLGVVLAALGSGCHAQRIPPPPDAPSVTRPQDALPADLDLVIRLDLRRIRDTLGDPAMTALGKQAVQSLSGVDQGTDALLLTALARTDTLWLGLRPTQSLRAVDSVWVMSGHFSDFDPHRAKSTPRFQLPVELGGNLRRYERVQAPTRSAPARIYTYGDDLVVSLSEAEIDSVERSFEQRRGAPALEPAEQGVLSAVARPRYLPAEFFANSDTLRKVAQRAARLELKADLTGAGLDATLALKFEDPATAERVGQALTEMRDVLQIGPGRVAKFATRLQVESAGPYVSLKLTLGRDELSELVNCRGSACAW